MTSKHTDKYQLSQWEKSDKVLMEDFNGDNQKIEDALAGLAESKAEQWEVDGLASALLEVPRVVFGSYEGTGEYGGKYTSVTFPFEPKLVLVMGDNLFAIFMAGINAARVLSGGYQGLLVVKWEGATLSWYVSSATVWGSNTITSAGLQLNNAGATYQYFAIG